MGPGRSRLAGHWCVRFSRTCWRTSVRVWKTTPSLIFVNARRTRRFELRSVWEFREFSWTPRICFSISIFHHLMFSLLVYLIWLLGTSLLALPILSIRRWVTGKISGFSWFVMTWGFEDGFDRRCACWWLETYWLCVGKNKIDPFCFCRTRGVLTLFTEKLWSKSALRNDIKTLHGRPVGRPGMSFIYTRTSRYKLNGKLSLDSEAGFHEDTFFLTGPSTSVGQLHGPGLN